jgi:hypothetical protein
MYPIWICGVIDELYLIFKKTYTIFQVYKVNGLVHLTVSMKETLSKQNAWINWINMFNIEELSIPYNISI